MWRKNERLLEEILADRDAECVICGSPFVAIHRMVPGAWGGKYEIDNVELLCPNHHAMIHLLMRWMHRPGIRNERQEVQLLHCFRDRPLMAFWQQLVRPIVIERMKAEGRCHPYIRTLPVKA